MLQRNDTEFVEVISLNVQYIPFTLEENVVHRHSKLEDPSKAPTLVGLNLPLASLVSITNKRKQLLTCTQETTRAKLEQLRLARLIHG
jgi:hypothetical protein